MAVLTLFFLANACQPKGIPEDLTGPKPAKLTPTTQVIVPTMVPTGTPTVQVPTLRVTLPAPENLIPTFSIAVTETPNLVSTQPTPTATTRSFRLPTPTARPQQAHMRITKPGLYSKISSPLQVEALINPGDDGMVHVDLIGEDGRTLVSQLLDFRNVDAKNFYITPELNFQINSAGELARLVIYTHDQFDQVIGLVSVDVILIQMGDSDITPPIVDLEPYQITTPREGTLIKGGNLTVTGAMRPVNNNPLVLQLIDEQGVVVGESEIPATQPSDASPQVPFQTTINYTVSHRVRVRLTLSQASDGRIPGTAWLSSSILFLDP